MQKYSFFRKVSTYSHSFGQFNCLMMLVFEKVEALREHISKLKKYNRSIGFVPTMGALHSGHLALTQRAKADNDVALVSIFVNPTQFNKQEDLEKYPRNTDKDIRQLSSLDCDIVFLPEVNEIYPDKVESEVIDLNGLDTYMEGFYRKDHFEGVATVIKRFFEIITPNKAYFGEKDFQQLLIVKRVAEKFNPTVEVIGHPTERSTNGLALSSRNERLTTEQLDEALIVYQSMIWAQKNYLNFSPSSLKTEIEKQFSTTPLDLEYVELCDSKSLQPIQEWHNSEKVRLFISAYYGTVRLIDNLSLN